MREEGTGNLLGDEGRGITSVEEGFPSAITFYCLLFSFIMHLI